MKTMTVPDFSTPTIGRKSYKRFRGVDYSTDETQIDDGRSPRAVNVIADEGGAPERRWAGAQLLTSAVTSRSRVFSRMRPRPRPAAR